MEVVRLSPEDTAHLTLQKYFWFFCYRLSRPQGSNAAGSIVSVTPSGIEPTTFRLVTQGLNQLRQREPLCLMPGLRNSRNFTPLCHIYSWPVQGQLYLSNSGKETPSFITGNTKVGSSTCHNLATEFPN